VSDSLGCEHGEWSRWWNGRQTGIPSPIEQNHRHIHLLERVFDDGLVRPPKRLGFMPIDVRFRLARQLLVCLPEH
jgi:hypothetical protein